MSSSVPHYELLKPCVRPAVLSTEEEPLMERKVLVTGESWGSGAPLELAGCHTDSLQFSTSGQISVIFLITL